MPTRLELAIAALLLVAAGALSYRWIAAGARRRRIGSARRQGRRAERRAMRLLRRHGYELVDTQVERTGTMLVDGEPATFRVRADALVSRDGRLYVVEVKGGLEPRTLAGAATRRQLLEYTRVFGVDGIVLVDGTDETLHHVVFPGS